MGLPRSGKTTWAREQGFPIVCPDAVRLALHNQRFEQCAEPFVWAIVGTMIRALYLAGHRVVILDATNNTRKRRDPWRGYAEHVQFATFPADAAECTTRAMSKLDREIVPVIERMAEQHEPLEPDEEGMRLGPFGMDAR